MSDLGDLAIVVVAVALLVAAALLLRSRRVSPWPAIVVAAFSSGVCFTVGGNAPRAGSEPNVATVAAAIVGLITVAAAILSLIRWPESSPIARTPILVAVAGIAIGAVGLLVNQLVG
jgi:hypothetical protein